MLTQFTAAQIVGLAFAIWALGLFSIASFPILQNTGYMVFLFWELVSPTLITLFLYIRSIRAEQLSPEKFQLHVAWLVTLAVVAYLGIDTWAGNPAGSDLVQGLRFDLYQFEALIMGCAAFWICRRVMERFRPTRIGSAPGAAPDGGPRSPSLGATEDRHR